jgi:hypothetical protein
MTRKGNVDIITHRNPELTSQLSTNNLPIITVIFLSESMDYQNHFLIHFALNILLYTTNLATY